MRQLCSYFSRCPGCPTPYIEDPVFNDKCLNFKKLFQSFLPHSQAFQVWAFGLPLGFRLKIDFTVQNAQMGFWKKKSSSQAVYEIFPVESCPLGDDSLQSWMRELGQTWPHRMRPWSVRLRHSPNGDKGIWIRAANEEIRDILEQETPWLMGLVQAGILVEVGEKSKRVYWDQEKQRWQLHKTPQLAPWFQTQIDSAVIPLWGTMASFTQPSLVSASEMVQRVVSYLRSQFTPQESICEFFAGHGLFSLAIAQAGFQVHAFEWSMLAQKSLEASLPFLDPQAQKKISFIQKNLYRNPEELFTTDEKDLVLQSKIWLLDPPRSGLQKFRQVILFFRPENLILISCSAESLHSDLEELCQEHYKVKQLVFIDQFPHSTQGEFMVFLEKRGIT
jgi:tRNA/tmRNA/rRNA uracil-C5-methylase (TrmA/RlmC/RlmD family)